MQESERERRLAQHGYKSSFLPFCRLNPVEYLKSGPVTNHKFRAEPHGERGLMASPNYPHLHSL